MTLPSGTVTFVFTDLEGSTRLLQELGDRYRDVVRDHRSIVRDTFGAQGGSEVDTQGDRCCARAQAGFAGRALCGFRRRYVQLIPASSLAKPVEGRAREACAWPGHNYARALLGNDLPDGAAVVDLGRQNLKEHEDSADALAAKIQRNVNEYVQQSIERSLRFDNPQTHATLFRLGLAGIATLVVFVAAIVGIVLLIKLVF